MKVGQLMSMDGHRVLPAGFTQMLGGLREIAHTMPATQLAEVLQQACGDGWRRRYRRFSDAPVASASSDQVARLHFGTARAVLQMMLLAGEPLRQRGVYDFGASDLFGRVFRQGQAQFFGDGCARTPPPGLLFLRRKFIGTFMLCSRLRASRPGGAFRRPPGPGGRGDATTGT